MECIVGPDQPPFVDSGTEVVTSFGGLYTIGNGEAKHGKSIMTLGYDPAQKKFVGTFIATMMTHLWVYNGSLDAARKVLTLDAEGPSFSSDGTSDGTMAKYQDIIEFVDDNTRTLKSQVWKEGKWQHFMTGIYKRKT